MPSLGPLRSSHSWVRQLSRLRGMSTSQNTPRDYNAAVAALNGLQSDYATVKAFERLGPEKKKLAIPEMTEWARRIGYEPPDFDKLRLIHVAGTKGKGSTSSFISSILAQYLPVQKSVDAAPLTSVGLFTSPHLRSVRERIQIDNKPISEDLFSKYFWELWDRFEATSSDRCSLELRNINGKPVYFHYLTLMALHCYLQEKVDSCVIECGIGGEYDRTNILHKPTVAAVTNLGMDHEAILGDNIESIAWHKAGIFKEGVPAFTVSQPQEAMVVLQDRAIERGTQLHVAPVRSALRDIRLGLRGDFQHTNASLAIAVSAEHLRSLGYDHDVPDPLDPSSPLPREFVAGLESARLGGRCDMRPDTRVEELTWYIDGGHTLESIDVAGRWFASSTGTRDDDTTTVLIFNQQMRDAPRLARRLHSTLASALGDARPFKHVILCTHTTYKDSGYKADLVSVGTNKLDIDSLKVQRELASTWNEIDVDATTHIVGTIEEAVAKARDVAAGKKTEVLVTGSMHLVGGLIEVIESEAERAADTGH